MRYAAITDRLAAHGSAKWAVHMEAKALRAAGRPVIMLSVGEPDVPTPPELVAALTEGLAAGRTGYSNGHGEPALLDAIAAKYAARSGRPVTRDEVVCLPGTQTALYAVLMALLEFGDEAIVADPMYATYEGVIAAPGGIAVPVTLRPERGFRLDARDVAAKVTARTRVLLLNSPHNPTGAVLTAEDIRRLGEVARAHDLWIVSDEVYEELTFGAPFVSPFDLAGLAERTVVVSSISKSHAAPGFRSGWCVGPVEFCRRLLPLAETMLFGNQPFIADMTAAALATPSPVAAGMRERLARRSAAFAATLDGVDGLAVPRSEAGMFALVDVRATGLSGIDFAFGLLREHGVAVMPGESFGAGLAGWLRLALTVPDADLAEAAGRIAAHAAALRPRKIA